MTFDSLAFALFFVVVLLVTILLRRHVRGRNVFLLLASYLFYSCWDWRFLGLIIVSTLVDFLCGIRMNVNERDIGAKGVSASRSRHDRWWLGVSLGTNLGLLGFFKYFNFFIETASSALEAIGLSAHQSSLQIILPVGISFYTFQTLSYTIDVYRRRIPTERSILNFATFVAFFPQLVAGPIERASHFLPQVRSVRTISYSQFSSGMYLIVWGLIEKIVIADNAAKVADALFGSDRPGGLDVIIGVYAFSIQIYCDFSGYTNIARGVARCLGFDLMRNFSFPYFAVNPRDFWNRWHISLSTWLRDYLYIPLGGSRRGKVMTYRNLFITMTLGGLWHGAGLHFVLWGVFHGAILSLHRVLDSSQRRVGKLMAFLPPGVRYCLKAALFFQVTCLGWLIFRADDIPQLGTLLHAVITSPTTTRVLESQSDLLGLMVSYLFLFVYEMIQFRRDDPYVIFKAHTAIRGFLYAAMLLAIILFGNYGGGTFIYFQF